MDCLVSFAYLNVTAALADDGIGDIHGCTGKSLLDEISFLWAYHFVDAEV